MGLDFSHSDAHFTYSGFNEFRRKLANLIGLNLDKMQGFNQGPDVVLWDNIKDPIVPFLYHSDCDGHLTPKQCSLIGPRLIELASKFEVGSYYRDVGLELGNDLIKHGKQSKSNFEFV